MENMAEEAKALLAVAERQGAENLREKILAPTAAMPSIEEVESELRGNFREQEGDVVVISNANDSSTG